MDYGRLALKKIEELQALVGGMRDAKREENNSVSVWSNGIRQSNGFSFEIRFKAASLGKVVATLTCTFSRAVKMQFLLDGVSVYNVTTTSGSLTYSATCNGVEPGVHVLTVAITGTSFNLTNMRLTATGKLVISDDDVFAEGFPGGSLYFVKNLGKLDVYNYAGSTSLEFVSLDGISDARAIECGNSYLAFVTDTGKAALILLGDVLKIVPVCGEAISIGGISLYDGIIELFVAKQTGVCHYRHDITDGQVYKCADGLPAADSLLAVPDGDSVCLVCGRSGYVTLSRSMPNADYTAADRFTVRFTKEA